MCVVTEAIFNVTTDVYYETGNQVKTDLYAYYGTYDDNNVRNAFAAATDGSVMWSGQAAMDPMVTFTVEQNIQGIVPTEFTANGANSVVLAHAVAATLDNKINPDNVKVSDLHLSVASRLRRLTEASTDVTYTVTYDALHLNYDTATEGNEALTTMLLSAIEDGTFTANLQSANTQLMTDSIYGDLGSCTSDSATVSYEGNTPTVDDDLQTYVKKEQTNVVAGVIIGIGAIVFFVGAFLIAKAASS